MKTRTCNVHVVIFNDQGLAKSYRVRPLTDAELGPDFVAGFRLSTLHSPPCPFASYLVRLTPGAVATCTCPCYVQHSRCKHAEALTAARLLPTNFVDLLWERTALLDVAESKARAADPQYVATLEEQVTQLEQRCLQLQTALSATVASSPKRRTRKARAA